MHELKMQLSWVSDVCVCVILAQWPCWQSWVQTWMLCTLPWIGVTASLPSTKRILHRSCAWLPLVLPSRLPETQSTKARFLNWSACDWKRFATTISWFCRSLTHSCYHLQKKIQTPLWDQVSSQRVSLLSCSIFHLVITSMVNFHPQIWIRCLLQWDM